MSNVPGMYLKMGSNYGDVGTICSVMQWREIIRLVYHLDGLSRLLEKMNVSVCYWGIRLINGYCAMYLFSDLHEYVSICSENHIKCIFR